MLETYLLASDMFVLTSEAMMTSGWMAEGVRITRESIGEAGERMGEFVSQL